MIGDGMGTSQIYSAYIANKGFLNLERCKYIGFVKTYSANSLITDSSAAGTALATGYKTNQKMLGMAPDSTNLTSILKYAETNNKSTGLVATSKINHATPAAFIANNVYRYNYEEIAYDFLKTDIDVFIGGGLDNFTTRVDSLNLLDSLKARNYEIITSLKELENTHSEKIAGLLYAAHPPSISEGRGDMLTTSSLKAIETLNKNKEGFFLMIEGSQIDWGGHDTLTSYVVEEVVDFDNTVGAVLDFAEQDGNTLVIITSDHETGGFAIIGGDISTGIVEGAFTTEHHTAVMVPVFAFGPGAEEFTGFMDNTDIFKKMVNAFNFKLD
ncbi:MAG: alkaline phosphatase [Bacteroidetes bacterium]|nr:alkaline phosphatase [Bacteroidota bacterium]